MKGFFSHSPLSRQASQKEMSARGWGREKDGPVSHPWFEGSRIRQLRGSCVSAASRLHSYTRSVKLALEFCQMFKYDHPNPAFPK